MGDHKPRKVVIMGAAGRDFHDFNVFWRDNPTYEVVGFTATQIPNIEGRTYPPQLAGSRYPNGIPIYPESELTELIRKLGVQDVTFAYSDVPHDYVMHRASQVLAAGANFQLIGPGETMLAASRPVISVCAVRTGCGKSQTARRVSEILKELGCKVAVVRHPMPYGDLTKQVCQRFAEYADLDKHHCTIEEREEYEPHLRRGSILFAGIDYAQILQSAEKEADVILWDGGNNDLPFFKPTLHIVVTDPHRVGHETAYHPGEANLRMADLVVINKVATAEPDSVKRLQDNIRRVNPAASVILANSPVSVENGQQIKGKRVLAVEDGPTLTHGGMGFGAAHVVARQFGAAQIVDPRAHAAGSIKDVYAKYPHLTDILPAMGYGSQQIAELEATINAVPCDLVLIGTPIDLGRLIRINKPSMRVFYELEEHEPSALRDAIAKAVKR
jgi:predicted GTPase